MKVINKSLNNNDVKEFLKDYTTEFLIDMYIAISDELLRRGYKMRQVYIENK